MTDDRKTILGVFAHPDDELMGPGGTLAKYAALGHRVAFITATEGGAGRFYASRPEDNSDLRARRREETEAAARILGVESLGFLGWPDGGLQDMNPLEVEIELARLIRREKPDVLITFHGSGISYHPDHRVISMALTAAAHGAARAGWYRDPEVESLPPHRVARLYHFTGFRSDLEKLEWPREIYLSPDEEITTVIDTRDTADTKWEAIQAHDSQRDGPPFKVFYDAGVFDHEGFVRVLPSWPAGQARKTDLLDGMD